MPEQTRILAIVLVAVDAVVDAGSNAVEVHLSMWIVGFAISLT